MNKPFFLKLLIVSGFILLNFAFALSISAQNVPIEKIQEAVDKLPSYKDVPSSIDCKTAKSKAEKIICGSSYLTLMERLDTRAAVYAYENATKNELPHNQKTAIKYSLITKIRKLKTDKAIRDAFIKHTNDSLGGESPYYKD